MIRRLLPLFAFLALAALLLVGVRMNSGKDTSAIPSPLIGKPAPSFSLPVLGEPGRMVSDKDLLGQPYLLNVWGSWCPSCRYEHPFLIELSGQQLLPIIGLNWKDDPVAAKNWLTKYGDPYRLSVSDLDGRVAIDWGVYGAPETFIIDKAGNVRYKYSGPIDRKLLNETLLPIILDLQKAL